MGIKLFLINLITQATQLTREFTSTYVMLSPAVNSVESFVGLSASILSGSCTIAGHAGIIAEKYVM